MDAEEFDDMYPRAVECAKKYEAVGPMLFQRQFLVGYNRARRWIEAMESSGLLIPKNDGTGTWSVSPQSASVK